MVGADGPGGGGGRAAEGGSEWRKKERAGAYMVEAFGTG